MIRVVQEGREEGGGVGIKEGGAEGEEEEVGNACFSMWGALQ